MAGYNRISPNPFVDGAIIEASDFDTEFGTLDTAFGTGGHTHDGTDGNGPKIDTAGLALNAVDSTILDETDSSYAVAGMTIDSLTITSGTAVTSIDTDLTSVSTSDDTLASAKAIKTYVDAQVTASDLDFQGDSGGALSIDLDSETLTIAGGTGLTTTGSGNTLTVDIDSTVATLTGTQTLTNKTLTSPDINTPDIDGGTIDGTAIGGTTAAAGSFTTVSTTGNITVGGTVDGRDVATDGTKLDGIETGADVTDATNVTAAGALMDSEVTNLAQVKAFSSADYATAAQGTTADSALQPSDNISELTNDSGYLTGNQTITLSGDATGSGTTAITVALAANTVGVSELNLTDGTAGQFLKTDGAGTISFATAPTQATSFTTLEVEPTSDHAIFSLQNTATNTFGDSKSYHEIRYQAKDLVGVDTTYAEIEGRTYATGERGQLNFLIKGASGLETYLSLVGDDQRIEANKNIRFNTAGTGIDFSATSDATGMTNELLDDYEEGGWTPNFSDGTTTTFSGTRIGKYVKVGQMVTAWASISNGSTSGLTSTASLRITGLPFTGENANAIERANSSSALLEGVSYTTDPVVYLTNNGNRDYVNIWDQGAGTSIKVSDVTSGTNFISFTLTYLAG
jgi:hypothetical protein